MGTTREQEETLTLERDPSADYIWLVRGAERFRISGYEYRLIVEGQKAIDARLSGAVGHEP